MSDLHYKANIAQILEIARNGFGNPSGLTEVVESKLREFQDMVAELTPEEVALVVSNMGIDLDKSARKSALIFQNDFEDEAEDIFAVPEYYTSGIVIACLDTGIDNYCHPVSNLNEQDEIDYLSDIEKVSEFVRHTASTVASFHRVLREVDKFTTACRAAINEIVELNDVPPEANQGHFGFGYYWDASHHSVKPSSHTGGKHWNMGFSRLTINSSEEKRVDWPETAFGCTHSEALWSPELDQSAYMLPGKDAYITQLSSETHSSGPTGNGRKVVTRVKRKRK